MNNNLEKEINNFGLYARDFGVSTTSLDGYKKYATKNTLISPTNVMTPYILEERSMNVTQMDVFSRLMLDRIIWMASDVNERMSPIIQAQLMFLDSAEEKDINLYVDSPGGSVTHGLSIVDTMDFITSDVATTNTGMAASMGSVILGAGTKGKRSSLRFARTMLHQSSGGATGNIQDAEIAMREWKKLNKTLFELLGQYCDKDPKEVKRDSKRDLWLDSSAAKEYGIIDQIVTKKKK